MIYIVSRAGVGDILTTRDFLSGYMNNQENYTICYPEDILPPTDTEHYKLLVDLHNSIFTESNIVSNFKTAHRNQIWSASPQTEGRAYTVFSQKEGAEEVEKHKVSWRDAKLRFNKIPGLCDDDTFQGDYAVITTRDRSDLRQRIDFFSVVKKTLEILNENYSKILVVGEKTENNLYKECRFDDSAIKPSLYNFILQNINKDKMIDMTSRDLSLDQFKHENSLCRDAKKVVAFGCGGNYARQLYIGSNTSALMCNSYYNFAPTIMIRESQKNENPNLKNIQIFSYDQHGGVENFYKSLSE